MKMHNHTRPFSLSGYVHTRPFSLSRRVKKVISSSGRRPTHDEEGRTSKAGGVQNYTNEFVHAFFEFIATSATSQRSRLARLCAPDAFLVPDAAILLQGRQKSNVGVEAVLDALSHEYTCYSRQEHTVHAVAATPSPTSDTGPTTVFALVGFALKDAQGTPSHAATFRVSRGFGIFKLRMQDSLFQEIEFKRQLTHEEVEGLLLDPIHVYPPPFPLNELNLQAGGTGKDVHSCQQRQNSIRAVVEQWVMAHSNEADLSVLDAILSEDCRLLEAYGVWGPTFPALPQQPQQPAPPSALSTALPHDQQLQQQLQQQQSPRTSAQRKPLGGAPQDPASFSVRNILDQMHHRSRFISGSQVISLFQVLHSAYNVLSIKELTIAVDERADLAFASWSSNIQNKSSGKVFTVREMEAITLHPPTQDEIVAEQRWKEKQARQKQGEQEQEQEQEQEKEKEQDHEQEQKQEQELEQQQGLKGKLGGVLEQGKRQGWKLRSIWSIRDPLDYERAVLLRPHRPPVEAQPAQGASIESLLAGFPSPHDVISAMQQKVGTTDYWAALAQSMNEMASAFSAAAVAAAARAQGGAPSQGGMPRVPDDDASAARNRDERSPSPPPVTDAEQQGEEIAQK